MRVLLATIGCKVNQADSEAIKALLISLGASVDGDWQRTPDAVVINSCAVTGHAERDCRKLVRRARRRFPAARVALVGCVPQVNPKIVHELPEADALFSTTQKVELVHWLTGLKPRQLDETAAPLQPLPRPLLPSRTRPSLVVQLGCDNRCSYCVVPYARGVERSLPPDDVQAELTQLAQRGAPEVVLVGIHLGRYGRGLDPPLDLAGLLQRLLALDLGDDPPRLRLSSLDPHEIDEHLVELLADPRICPHVHLALQSADPEVLQQMRRPYGPQAIEGALELLRRIVPLTVGADVLVGFPGESQAAFERTLSACAQLELSYLHVFPFSARPGTAAYELEPLPPDVVRERAARMRELGERLRQSHLESSVGRTLELVVERLLPDGRAAGTTELYHPGITQQAMQDLRVGARLKLRAVGIEGRALVLTRAVAD
ncbi:MAG: MiaB/RimO family radical SAM methylthiotransferase [Candidatus Alcyoniella australis]|nr:MiaB/RimO family radical SAM methylthiotransferase [Candidatus Alcyoniella australis]